MGTPESMWNLNLDQVRRFLVPGTNLPRIAIETGTCRGHSTRILARSFDRVFTIELNENLFRTSREALRSDGIRNVEFLHGNSADLLPSVLAALPAEPVFFFLDAHWSGDQTVDWARAKWKGYGLDTSHLGKTSELPSAQEQCPLQPELQAIVAHCSGAATILIDDLKNIPESGPGLRGHEFPGEDWSHLTREILLQTVGTRLRSAHVFRHPCQFFFDLHERSDS